MIFNFLTGVARGPRLHGTRPTRSPARAKGTRVVHPLSHDYIRSRIFAMHVLQIGFCHLFLDQSNSRSIRESSVLSGSSCCSVWSPTAAMLSKRPGTNVPMQVIRTVLPQIARARAAALGGLTQVAYLEVHAPRRAPGAALTPNFHAGTTVPRPVRNFPLGPYCGVCVRNRQGCKQWRTTRPYGCGCSSRSCSSRRRWPLPASVGHPPRSCCRTLRVSSASLLGPPSRSLLAKTSAPQPPLSLHPATSTPRGSSGHGPQRGSSTPRCSCGSRRQLLAGRS